MTSLEPKKWDVLVVATFERPSFNLPSVVAALMSDAFVAFAPAKPKIGDFRVEGSAAAPGEYSVNCLLLDAGIHVKFRADAIELWSDRLQAGDPLFLSIASAACDVGLRHLQAEAKLANVLVIASVHANFGGAQPGAQTPLSAIPAPPPLRVSGVSFEAEVTNGRGGTLIIEKSFVVPDALFTKVTAMFDGSIPVQTALRNTLEFRSRSLAVLGLEVKSVA